MNFTQVMKRNPSLEEAETLYRFGQMSDEVYDLFRLLWRNVGILFGTNLPEFELSDMDKEKVQALYDKYKTGEMSAETLCKRLLPFMENI